MPPQYQQALRDADALALQYPGILITGHSLGGGLATYVSAMTGLPAHVFNPAGLGQGARNQSAASGTGVHEGQLTTYVIPGEVLTTWSLLIGQPGPSGKIVELPYQDNVEAWGPLANHQTETISQAINQLERNAQAPRE